jgi:exopolysaccharide biosynthesis polyprenyl glycosylphosphotransferase
MSKRWMLLDVITILGAAVLAALYELHVGPLAGAKRFWHGTLIYGRPMWTLLALLCGFAVALIVTGRRLHLYSPMRLGSILHEQRLSAQSCFTSGLLLTSMLYLVHADEIPRRIVLFTLGLVTIFLGVHRLAGRFLLYRRFERGIGTRKVLIVGTGPQPYALRHHLESTPHLGYTVKGFIESPVSRSSLTEATGEVVGMFEAVFQHARRQFVDEIFFASPCDRSIVLNVLEQARTHGVDVRVALDMYHGLAWSSSIEYIDQFPTLLFHPGHVSEFSSLFKRALDMVFSSVALIAISPLLLAIAVAIKLDSQGPVFYFSKRIGKKGRVFRCTKFRTMVRDAEKRRAEILHLNERDGVLFKVTNDPRTTRLGRFLRKYSLDELPQFFNVLRGDMSIVGPRPPLAEEVKEYELGHLRRLDVTPGITGLWQVQSRQDPSFASYVSLDMKYIDNWSIWLDFKIVLRTIGVVLAGTGS